MQSQHSDCRVTVQILVKRDLRANVQAPEREGEGGVEGEGDGELRARGCKREGKTENEGDSKGEGEGRGTRRGKRAGTGKRDGEERIGKGKRGEGSHFLVLLFLFQL